MSKQLEINYTQREKFISMKNKTEYNVNHCLEKPKRIHIFVMQDWYLRTPNLFALCLSPSDCQKLLKYEFKSGLLINCFLLSLYLQCFVSGVSPGSSSLCSLFTAASKISIRVSWGRAGPAGAKEIYIGESKAMFCVWCQSQ